MMPPVNVHPYTYMPHLVRQPPGKGPNTKASFTNPVVVPDLDNPKKDERLKKSSPEQANNINNLFEERLREVDGSTFLME